MTHLAPLSLYIHFIFDRFLKISISRLLISTWRFVFPNFFCHIGRTDVITTETWARVPFNGTFLKTTSDPNRLRHRPTSTIWCHLPRQSSPATENLVNANLAHLARGLMQVRLSSLSRMEVRFSWILNNGIPRKLLREGPSLKFIPKKKRKKEKKLCGQIQPFFRWNLRF